MAEFYARCAKCGVEVALDAEFVRNALLMTGALPDPEHDCDTPAEPEVSLRRFRIQFAMYELPPPGDEAWEGTEDVEIDPVVWIPDVRLNTALVEAKAGLGHTVDAATFAEAVNGPMTEWLDKTWARFKMDAAWADVPSTAD